MEQADIIRAAHVELEKLDSSKPWMTARGLARRIRGNQHALPSLTQVALYDSLAAHAEQAAGRVIRNSASPSAITLEVLWGAVSRVDEREVEPPRKRAAAPGSDFDRFLREQDASNESRDKEVNDDPADFFLSYNFDDSEAAAALTQQIEGKGHSVWMAGTSIACGEIINDTVRDAIDDARELLLYLSAQSLRSLWVAKEQLVGLRQQKPRTVIVNGEDADLMGLVQHWVAGGQDDERVGEFGGLRQIDSVSYSVAASFREQLRSHLTESDSKVYVFPWAANVNSDRLLSLDVFPCFGD